MLTGLYAAAASMTSQGDSLDLIAGNLANANTPGYKRDVPSFSSSLLATLDPASLDPAGQSIIESSSSVDLSNGSIRQTGNMFDLALQGPGFLVVRTPSGEAYTRNGTLSIHTDGRLMTQNGDLVLGERGPINVNGKHVSINARGDISVDGRSIDRLRLVDIAPTDIRRSGESLVLSAGTATPLDWSKTEVKQGCLEQSNVSVMWEMVSLITVTRLFEANQRAIQVQDQVLDKAVNTLGQV